MSQGHPYQQQCRRVHAGSHGLVSVIRDDERDNGLQDMDRIEAQLAI